MTEEEAAAAPGGNKDTAAYRYAAVQVRDDYFFLDCTGCGSCANVCPGKKGGKHLRW